MTNKQINQAVAEELGWTNIRPRYAFGPALIGLEPRYQQECRVPDFCNDYNAVAEMRKSVRPDEEEQFGSLLSDEVDEDETTFCRGVVSVINITPFKQTRAFLRLRGKWRDG